MSPCHVFYGCDHACLVINIINLVHMEMLKNNAFVGNTGHFDNEVDNSR